MHKHSSCLYVSAAAAVAVGACFVVASLRVGPNVCKCFCLRLMRAQRCAARQQLVHIMNMYRHCIQTLYTHLRANTENGAYIAKHARALERSVRESNRRLHMYGEHLRNQTDQQFNSS